MFPAVVWGCRSLDLGPTLPGRARSPSHSERLEQLHRFPMNPRSDSTTSSPRRSRLALGQIRAPGEREPVTTAAIRLRDQLVVITIGTLASRGVPWPAARGRETGGRTRDPTGENRTGKPSTVPQAPHGQRKPAWAHSEPPWSAAGERTTHEIMVSSERNGPTTGDGGLAVLWSTTGSLFFFASFRRSPTGVELEFKRGW